MTEAENPQPQTHRPGPLRKWRRYLKEYAVVVLGVLTALLLEQAVQNWREHRQYLEARDAMRFELANNLASSAPRTAISECNQKRLTEISGLLQQAENREGFAAPLWAGDTASARIRYTAEEESGRSGLFSPAEQRLFGRIYSFLHSIDAEQDRERQAWARLRMLEGRSSLSPEMIVNLSEAVAQARYADDRIGFLRGFVGAIARELDITALAIDPAVWPKAWPACLPMTTPREEARRLIAYPGNTRP